MISRSLIWLLLCGFGIALALLLLGGCGDQFNTPVKREYTKPVMTVEWIEVGSDAELRAACARTSEDPQILGCAYIAPLTTTCTIYTHKNPTLDILGHEMLHCFTGRWHS